MWFDGAFQIWTNGSLDSNATRKKLASFKNNVMFQNTFMRLLSDALERYDFDGLPDTVNKRVLLQGLLWYGCVVFFEKVGSLLCLPCAPNGGEFNIYGDPGKVWAFSRNGQLNEAIKTYIPGGDESLFLRKGNGGATMSADVKGVVVWENRVRYPFINQVLFFADAISDSMRTLDVARANAKTPYIIVAEESVIPTVKQYFNSRDNNENVFVSSGIFPVDKVKVLPLVTDTGVLDNCTSLIEWYENKYRELCGIQSNAQQDKKGENLIQAEVHVNDMYEHLNVDKCVETIQECLDDANKIFGTNIKVIKKREDENNDEILSDEAATNSIPGDNSDRDAVNNQ